MKKNCVFGLLLAVFAACSPSSQDADFKAFLKSFHQAKMKHFPVQAVRVGMPDFDKMLLIPGRKKQEADLQFCKKYHDSLQLFDVTRLSVPYQFEYNKIKPFLAKYIHDFEILKIHENDPSWYDLRETFYSILKMENTPVEQRLELFESKLKELPEFYSTAKANLKTPDPQKLQEAVQQQVELYHFFEKQIPDICKSSDLSESQLTNLNQLALQAQLSIKDFIAFCNSAAFEYLDEALNATPDTAAKEQFEKIFTLEK